MEAGMDIPWDLQDCTWESIGVIRGVFWIPVILESLSVTRGLCEMR